MGLYITIGVVCFICGFIMCALFSLNTIAMERVKVRKLTIEQAASCFGNGNGYGTVPADYVKEQIRGMK